MPIRKHDRSNYQHLDSIDEDALAHLGAALAAQLAPLFQSSTGIPVTPADGQAVDATGRLRVAQATPLFEAQFTYDTNPLLWESVLVNASGNAAVAHLPAEASVRLSLGADDTVIRQSRQYHRCQPASSQQILMAFAPITPLADVTQRIGYFDAANGIFFELGADGSVNIVKRSATSGVVIETRVARASWNVDKLDGTGTSGYTLDFSKALLLAIDLEGLGVGRVRVGFAYNGLIESAHIFTHSNELTTAYMGTASLPLRYELVGAGGLAGTKTFRQMGSRVAAEGGGDAERGLRLATGNGASPISVTTRRPLLSIRPRLVLQGVPNRSLPLLEAVALVNTSANDAYYEVVYGATLTDAAYADVDTLYSGLEVDVAATALVGGVTLAANYLTGDARGATALEGAPRGYPLTLNAAGVHPIAPLTDSVTVVATSLSGTATLAAALTWREVRG